MVAALECRAATAAPDGADAVIVVLLPDSGRSYLPKIYNDGGCAPTVFSRRRAQSSPRTCSAIATDPLRRWSWPGPLSVGGRSRSFRNTASSSGLRSSPMATSEGVVGSITEKGLLDRASRPIVVERTVGRSDTPLPFVDVEARPRPRVRPPQPGVGCRRHSRRSPIRVVTRLGVLEYRPGPTHGWSARSRQRDGGRRSPPNSFELLYRCRPVHASAGGPRLEGAEARRGDRAALCPTRSTTSSSSGSPTCRSTPGAALFGRAIVQTEADGTRRIVGSRVFPARPDGRVVGYRVEPPHRRRSRHRVVHALFDWALAGGIDRFRLRLAGQCPSLAIITGLGFTQVGVQIDDIDGEELVFELDGWPPALRPPSHGSAGPDE